MRTHMYLLRHKLLSFYNDCVSLRPSSHVVLSFRKGTA